MDGSFLDVLKIPFFGGETERYIPIPWSLNIFSTLLSHLIKW